MRRPVPGLAPVLVALLCVLLSACASDATSSHEDPEQVETPNGVVLMSQTCDLVQDRERVLVAPVSAVSTSVMSAVRKGAKPLLIPVGGGAFQFDFLDHFLHLQWRRKQTD